MMSNILNLLTSADSLVSYVVLLILIIASFIIGFKFRSIGIYVFYVISVIVIGFGIYSTINFHSVLSVSSSDIGSAIHIDQEKDYDVVSSFDFGVIPLESDDNLNYYCVESFSFEEFDGKDKNYLLMFNDHLCDDIYITSGSINGILKLNFYDVNGDVIVTARMNILIEYFSKETRVSVSIINTDNAVSYINSEMNINGAEIRVVEVV